MTTEKYQQKKPVVLSGIQPSGSLGLGNYLGAMTQWVKMQDDYECIYLVVDLHALTVAQKPAELRKRCLSYVAQYVACGIDPNKSLIVIQSHVPQHAELAWVLNTMTYMGELNRMTQFKDKSDQHKGNVNVGLYTYPALMAADILLYQANAVPVGDDQRQHLELARDVAARFNNRYSPTFVVPEPFIPKQGARIMSLQDPARKMSKSDDNPNNYISLLDSPEVIRKKISRAVTDSQSDIVYDPKRPGLANLLTIFSLLSNQDMTSIEKHFQSKGYADLKGELATMLVDNLSPVQARYAELMNDVGELEEIMERGAREARRRARKTLSKVYRKVGLVEVSKRL
jgi:tryptophanyl-tRNA synthetase